MTQDILAEPLKKVFCQMCDKPLYKERHDDYRRALESATENEPYADPELGNARRGANRRRSETDKDG